MPAPWEQATCLPMVAESWAEGATRTQPGNNFDVAGCLALPKNRPRDWEKWLTLFPSGSQEAGRKARLPGLSPDLFLTVLSQRGGHLHWLR